MVDFSIFDQKDLHTSLQIRQFESLRINHNDSRVLCYGFVGGADNRHLDEVTSAMGRAVTYFQETESINLEYTFYNNDNIKNVKRWGPTEFIDEITKADFHLWTTHFHEGNIGKTGSWNMPNILSNLDRLEYHLGNLMGIKNKCPILRQGKIEVYKIMSDYCLPTIEINLPLFYWPGTLDVVELARLKEFIEMTYKSHPNFFNSKKEFIIKLPFASGGVVRDKSSIKYGVGLGGVVKAISEFIRLHPYVLGYIHYVIVQPRFPNSSEAKVVCFNCKARFHNPHKRGAGKSTLGTDDAPLHAFANEVIHVLRERCPNLIFEQILRVDFFQDPDTGRYYLNEIEGFNAQVVGLDSTVADLAKFNTDTEDYWFILICSLVYFVLDRRLKDKKKN